MGPEGPRNKVREGGGGKESLIFQEYELGGSIVAKQYIYRKASNFSFIFQELYLYQNIG